MTDAPLAEKILQRFVPVLFEDDDVLVVAKPSGVDLDPARDGSATSMRELLAACTEADPEKLQPVNRLSRFESGVMVWAKRSTVAQAYRKSLRAGHWEFEYLAVVTGKLKQPKLRIAGVHGSSRGQRPHHGRKTARGAEPLRTSPTTIERLKFGPQRLLVRCETSADTTHALRAQLRAAGLRLVGDHLGKGQEQRSETANTCLHLQRIRYTREGQNQHYVSRVAAPSDFDDAVSGSATIERHLATSLLRRLPCLLDEEMTAHGLLLGDEEQVPGLQAELLDSVIVLRVMERRADNEELVKRVGRWYRKTLGASSVYAKRIVKTTSKQTAGLEVDHQHAGALLGPPADEELVVLEHGMRFAVRPYDGVAVGLYFDQRENRTRVRSVAAGREVLNLFAYTCGFSVAAALGGASATTSVDISVKHLEWGKRNFELNGLDLEPHRFIRSEALAYFKRARRQELQFDMIILDPPTFARGRGSKQTFHVERDLPQLIRESLTVLRPGGELMISTNFRKLSYRWLEDCARENAGRRRARILDRPKLPADFAVDRDYAKTIFVRYD